MTKKDQKISEQKLEAKVQTSQLNIYQKLHAIQTQIGQLEKTRENKFQHYFYAGEYDLLKIIKPLLEKQQLILLFSDEITPETPLLREKTGKEWLVQYVKKAQLINVANANEQLTYYFWVMAENTDLAKAKGSAETYAVKYFLQKFFLVPTDKNLDPDAFSSEPLGASKEGETVSEEVSSRSTINQSQAESLINLFKQKTSNDKERQTNFLGELDKIMSKAGIRGSTDNKNFRERLGLLMPVDYQYLSNWLLKLETK